MGRITRFEKFGVFVIIYTVATILWGAWVRITGSGAGCGSHWPTCHGEIIPRSPSVETMIEYSHRLTSGLTLVFTLALFIWAFKAFPKGSKVRIGATGTLLFVLAEAILGAGLVLFELVGNNDSVARAIVIGFHLINTFGLLGFGVLTLWSAGGRQWSSPGVRWKQWVPALTLGLLAVGMSGAITALGDTLFPVDTSVDLMERLQADLSPSEHFLVRLRYIHPLLSIGVALGLMLLAISPPRPDKKGTFTSKLLLTLVISQVMLGWLNVELGAPGWMQLMHLLFADLLWGCFIWLALENLGEPRPTERV